MIVGPPVLEALELDGRAAAHETLAVEVEGAPRADFVASTAGVQLEVLLRELP